MACGLCDMSADAIARLRAARCETLAPPFLGRANSSGARAATRRFRAGASREGRADAKSGEQPMRYRLGAPLRAENTDAAIYYVRS